MSKWFGPRGQCGCCEIVCGCESDSTVPSPAFTGTPTFRITLAGLPATYEWSDFIGRIFFREKNDFTLTSLADANGTYFVELQKRNDFCINESAAVGFATTISYTRGRNTIFSDVPDICVPTSTTSSSTLSTLSFSVAAVGGFFSLIIVGGLPDYYQIKGQVEMSCPDYDPSTSPNTNSINGGFSASQFWPRSSGEIKIQRRAITTADCGYPLEDATGVIFETIGTISVELLEL